MAATVKCDTITNASNVGTANLALDSSGNVTVGAGLTVTGALTGSSTITSSVGALYPIVPGTPTSIVNTSTSTTISGIPSWVKSITLSGLGVVKAGGTSYSIIQFGTSGGFVTSGYVSVAWLNSTYPTAPTNGFAQGITVNGTNTQSFVGKFTLNNASTNQWTYFGNIMDSTTSFGMLSIGYVSLSGTLTQLKLLSSGGDAYSAGTLNITYE